MRDDYHRNVFIFQAEDGIRLVAVTGVQACALLISRWRSAEWRRRTKGRVKGGAGWADRRPDRKSTRLNSSHGYISYAVFCLKKKNQRPVSTTPSTATPTLDSTSPRLFSHSSRQYPP